MAQLCPLVLQRRQRREMGHGPTLLAHVCSISMYHYILNIRDSKVLLCLISDFIADCHYLSACCSFCVSVSSPCVCVCVCVSNGRAVHYNGSSLLQWKSVRLDVALLPGKIQIPNTV